MVKACPSKKFVFVSLSIPLAALFLIFALNFIVDPYEQNGWFHLGLDKYAVSPAYNYRLYKMSLFLKNPAPNIILGDSRMNGLDDREISRVSGKPYFNFAFKGGNINEMISTFWYCSRKIHLKNVYFGINFDRYNRYIANDLFQEALDLTGHKEKYYLSLFITKVSIANLYYKLFNKKLISETPQISKEQFWINQLRSVTSYYGRYKYPNTLYYDLKKIKAYCRRNDINLVFVIPPTHTDLQSKVAEFSLSGEYYRFKQDLASISKVIDFDYPNKSTEDKSLFNDPFHMGGALREELIKAIWGKKLEK